MPVRYITVTPITNLFLPATRCIRATSLSSAPSTQLQRDPRRGQFRLLIPTPYRLRPSR